MEIVSADEENIERRKPCTFCLFVRYLAVVLFLLAIILYFYDSVRDKELQDKERQVFDSMMLAEGT